MYWINFQNIYTFTYQKTLLHTFLLLVFEIIESLHCILDCQGELVLTVDKWEVKRVFSLIPMMYFGSEKKLSDFLVMANICPNERSVGLFKCGKKHCKVSKSVNKIEIFMYFFSYTKSMQSQSQWNHVKIQIQITIYLLMCNKCFKPGLNLGFYAFSNQRLPTFIKIKESFILMQKT